VNIKVLSLDQSEEWSEIIKSFSENDVYFLPEYCRPFYENGDGEPMLFYLEDECGRVANVFFKRDLSADIRFRDLVSPGKYYDLSSVYGYGGPLYETEDILKLQQVFSSEFTAFCNKNSIVADFVRFHCVLGNHRLMEGNYDIENVRTTVYIDLSRGEEYIWEDFDCKCRNNIRKTEKFGITVESGRDTGFIEAFSKLYKQTMERDNASSYYYFNDKFFDTTMGDLKDNSIIFTANYEGGAIASGLVIFSDKYAHIHFAASDSNFSYMRANNLLFYEIALWACRQGKKILHIGGGAVSDEDELFRFKKTFSKTNRLSFFIGRKVYDEAAYDELVKMRAANDSSFGMDTKYYPKYRG
jgi:hypothetical protein